MMIVSNQNVDESASSDKQSIYNETGVEHKKSTIYDKTKTLSLNDTSQQEKSAGNKNKQPPARRFYIDELGFYRFLDADQKHYVCSNINTSTLRSSNSKATTASTAKATATTGNVLNSSSNSFESVGESGFENCYKEIRRDLGISHFDRTEDYKSWKQSWDDFMRQKLVSQQPVTFNSQLKNRIRSGIPHDYRCKVWSALIRMRTKNLRAKFGEDIYNKIIRDYVTPPYTSATPSNRNRRTPQEVRPVGRHRNGQLTPVLSNDIQIENTTNDENKQQFESQRPFALEPLIDKCFKQIELDLLRTLPNNRHFENPNSNGIKRVRRVLRAYACFNQAVGYCQGMNRLAAMALLVLPEEEAFWCLVAIIQCIMPKDYYLKPWLAQVDCNVLNDLLEKKMPKLHKHLVKNDIQLTLFTWFFTIFVDGFRPELMLRIWDCFLLEGDKVLFRFALAILYISQDELLEMNDFSTMSTHLSKLVSTRTLDMEHLFEIAFRKMNPLQSSTLQARREFHRNRIQSTLDD